MLSVNYLRSDVFRAHVRDISLGSRDTVVNKMKFHLELILTSVKVTLENEGEN